MILKNPPVQNVSELNQLFLASMKRRNKKQVFDIVCFLKRKPIT